MHLVAKRLVAAAGLAAALAAAAPRAQAYYEMTFFPLAEGNEWTSLESGGAGAARRVTAKCDAMWPSPTTGQLWFRLLDSNGRERWVRQNTVGQVYEWGTGLRYRLHTTLGVSWTLAIDEQGGGAIACSNGATVTLLARNALVTTPLGTFSAVLLRFASACIGADDPSDGLTYRYAPGQLRASSGVPGHMALDPSTGHLYIADTGNAWIVRLDTRTSLSGADQIQAWHDETPLYAVLNTRVVAVTGAGSGLVVPAGLLLKGGDVVAGDFGNGHIRVFGADGRLEGQVNTGLGARALTGICESADGRLLALDAARNRLVEVEIAP